VGREGIGKLREIGFEDGLDTPAGGEDTGGKADEWDFLGGDPQARAQREVPEDGMVVAEVVVVGLKGFQMLAEHVAGDHAQGVHKGFYFELMANAALFDERGQSADFRGHGFDSLAQGDELLFETVGLGFFGMEPVNVPGQAFVAFRDLPAEGGKDRAVQGVSAGLKVA
jgi:hypothetical protein